MLDVNSYYASSELMVLDEDQMGSQRIRALTPGGGEQSTRVCKHGDRECLRQVSCVSFSIVQSVHATIAVESGE